MLLIIVRGPETALSSIILVAVSLSQINSVIVGGTASKRFGLFLACLVAVSCIWSIVEKLEPEESPRNNVVNRGQCVNVSKDWSSRIGNICSRNLGKEGFFYLDETVTQQDTEWPMKVYQISEHVRSEGIFNDGLKDVRFGNVNGYDFDVPKGLYHTFSWTSRRNLPTVEEYLGALLSLESRHGCDYWNAQIMGSCPKEALYTSENATCAKLLSEYLCTSLFPACKYDCSQSERHCGERRQRHEAAAHACRHILPVFSNSSLGEFPPLMRKDMENGRSWLEMFAEEDCLSGKVIEALRGLTIPLPLDNSIETCSEKKTGFCDPGYDFQTKEAEEKSSMMYLLLFPTIFMGEMMFLFLTKRDVKTERFTISSMTIPLQIIVEILAASLLIPSDPLIGGIGYFPARLVRLFSAVCVHFCAIPLLCIREEE